MKEEVTCSQFKIETLIKDNNFLLTILDNIQDGICVLDIDFNIKMTNRVMKKWFPRTLTENKCYKIFYEEPGPCPDCPALQLINSGKAYKIIKKYTHQDKSRWYCIQAFPVIDPDGNVIAVTKYMRDVTEIKNIEERVRDSEGKYQTYINQSIDGVFVIDGFGKFIDVNPSGCDTLGYSKDELLELTIGDVLDPFDENMKAGMEHFSNLVQYGKSRMEFTLLKKDGSKIIIENNGVALGNNRYMGIVRDITDRRVVENELQIYRTHLEDLVQERTAELENANRLLKREINERKEIEKEVNMKSHLLDAASDAIMAHDLDGNFIYVNEAGYKSRGYSQEEFMQLNLEELDTPAYARLIKKRIAELLEKGENVYESAHVCKDGSVMPVELSTRILELEDKSIILTVARDITDRKAMEQEISRLDRLNLIGQMAAGIGHEIRNPMTVVQGFLQLLSGKNDCQKYKEFYDLMIAELDRANSIITEFLSLASNKVINLGPYQINSIVENLYPLINAHATLQDKYIKLELGEVPNILLDEKEIRQLILNLVRNGMESMNPGQSLTIKTYAENKEVVLAVRDMGNGIDPDIINKISIPFFTTKDTGTGLGLAICHNIADRHSATIKFETSPEGTTFFVRFKIPAGG